MTIGLIYRCISTLRCRLTAAIVASVCAFGAAAAASEASVDANIFPRQYPILLAFDLQDDNRPQAALIIRVANSPPTDINVGLPFKVSDESTNEEGLFRLGRYHAWTLVTFWTTSSDHSEQISFIPEVNQSMTDYIDSDMGESTIYLVSLGQVRRFRYRYPDAATSKSFTLVPRSFQMRNVDAIAIALPTGAKELAVREGQLSIPARLNANQRVFPGVAGGSPHSYLDIVYEVPPTDFQKIVVKWGLKVVPAIVYVIVDLAVLRESEVRHPKLRRVLIWGHVPLVLIVLALIIWAALKSPGGGDVIGDLILLFTCAGYKVLTELSKGKQ